MTESVAMMADSSIHEAALGVARSCLRRAILTEPEVTRELRLLEGETCHLVGLDFRMKKAESLARKIESDARAKGVSLAEAAFGVSDVLRYTYCCSIDTLADDFCSVRSLLGRRGYSLVKVKNTLGETSVAYRGANTQVSTPGGFIFELQFHTTESLDVKERLNHPLYEKVRSLDLETVVGRARACELRAEMTRNSDTISTPPGMERVGI